MKSKLLCTFLVLLVSTMALPMAAQKDPYVGDVPMSPKKTLLENLASSPINTIFVKSLQAAQLDQTPAGSGAYTIFAPTDDAFRNLRRTSTTSPQTAAPSGLSPAVLKYHIVQGRLSSKKLNKLLKKGHGTATLQTIAGLPLTIKRYGSILVLTDARGGTATVITSDIWSRGGIFHVIDAVLTPDA